MDNRLQTAPPAMPGFLTGQQPPAAQTAPPSPAAQAAPAAPALPGDQVAVAPQATQAMVGMLVQQLRTGSSVDAAMAMGQLETLGAAHRQLVVPALIEQLGSDDPIKLRVALDGLMRLKATEALPHLQQLSISGSDEVKALAMQTFSSIGGSIAPPPAQQAPGAPPPITVGPPGAQAQAQAPAQAPGVVGGGDVDHLLELLKNSSTAPQAVQAMASLPTPQLLDLTRRALKDAYTVGPQATELLALTLVNRAQEPGVLDVLPTVLRSSTGSTLSPDTKSRLAYSLAGSQDPKHFTEALRVLADRNVSNPRGKRVVVDRLLKNPAAMAHPATAAMFAAVLNAHENGSLSAAVSHALGNLKNKTSRDALANSPLFRAADPKLRMRALWDLEKHPTPYPPRAIEQMQKLLRDVDPQVMNKAKELLNKSGVKV